MYDTYAQPVIRELIRTVLTRHTIDDVMQNREAVSAELSAAVVKELANSPIKVERIGLANIQPPPVIVAAQEAAKQMQIDGEKAEAAKTIALAKADADLEVAKKQQQVDLLKATTQVLVQQKLAEGTSQAYIAQRGMDVLEKLAASDNKVILLPTAALSDPALMIGVMQDALRGDSKKVTIPQQPPVHN